MRNLFITLCVWFVDWLPETGLVPEEYCDKIRAENAALREQITNQANRQDYEEFKWVKYFAPVLAERGRRVLGNLKQTKPRTVRCDKDLIPEHKTIMEPVEGGGCIGEAYVVDSMLDLQCLYLALSGGRAASWTEEPDVLIKGTSVICEKEVYKEECQNG